MTRDPSHEKIASSLNLSRGLLLVTTGGYIGDAPPYQGHVVSIHAATGAIAHVWNSLCSDRHGLLVPSHLLGERLGDLGPRRRCRRAGLGAPSRRDRQRAVGRQAELG